MTDGAQGYRVSIGGDVGKEFGIGRGQDAGTQPKPCVRGKR
jgi:hypothetical protein